MTPTKSSVRKRSSKVDGPSVCMRPVICMGQMVTWTHVTVSQVRSYKLFDSRKVKYECQECNFWEAKAPMKHSMKRTRDGGRRRRRRRRRRGWNKAWHWLGCPVEWRVKGPPKKESTSNCVTTTWYECESNVWHWLATRVTYGVSFTTWTWTHLDTLRMDTRNRQTHTHKIVVYDVLKRPHDRMCSWRWWKEFLLLGKGS